MLRPSYTKQFKKDLKRMEKRGKGPEKIKSVIESLINQIPLEEHNRDHKLTGNYKGRRECHVGPDWLLVYKLNFDEIIFERTGSHSDLFKN
jgi:mRNA interferase YafQ